MAINRYSIETLQVFIEAELLADRVWKIAYAKDFFVRDTIGKQLARAADSVSAFLAEGYAHYWFKESKRFYFYARASCLETKSWIRKLKSRGLYPDEECDELLQQCEKLFAKITNYISFVEKQQNQS